MTLPVVTAEFRLVADPNLRFAPSGVAVCSVRAVASFRKQVDGKWVDDKTCWVNLTGFDKQAENMAESFAKGDLVVVVGKISTEDWEDRDGNRRTSVNVVVDHIGPSVALAAAVPQRDQQRKSRASADESPWTPPQDEEPPF